MCVLLMLTGVRKLHPPFKNDSQVYKYGHGRFVLELSPVIIQLYSTKESCKCPCPYFKKLKNHSGKEGVESKG